LPENYKKKQSNGLFFFNPIYFVLDETTTILIKKLVILIMKIFIAISFITFFLSCSTTKNLTNKNIDTINIIMDYGNIEKSAFTHMLDSLIVIKINEYNKLQKGITYTYKSATTNVHSIKINIAKLNLATKKDRTIAQTVGVVALPILIFQATNGNYVAGFVSVNRLKYKATFSNDILIKNKRAHLRQIEVKSLFGNIRNRQLRLAEEFATDLYHFLWNVTYKLKN
jgi:hypothetical protein